MNYTKSVRAPAERVIYVHINKPFFLHLRLSATDYAMLYKGTTGFISCIT
jgi:hypothetical protein